MGVILGIDIGGSTTKIVGFDESRRLIEPVFVKATDPLTAAYGAFGKFTDSNGISLSDIKKVTVTGVGSTYLTKPIYGLECIHVSEFDCIGLGGRFLSGLDDCIVVSMGTGTAIVKAKKGEKISYLGGTGVGGGTITGIAKNMLGVSSTLDIVSLAETGSLENIDLTVGDLTNKSIGPMSSTLTAANFGKVSDLATKGDLALGLINMVFESVAMLSIFAGRYTGINDIVMTGNLTTIPQAKTVLEIMNKNFEKHFIIPDNSNFATVIGAALTQFQ